VSSSFEDNNVSRHSVNYAALTGDDHAITNDIYSCNKHTLSFLTSGRDCFNGAMNEGSFNTL